MTTIKSYKGFNKDMTCRGFQFEEGKEYETDKAECCESGFHACEQPLDVFAYYDPASSVFHEVEQSGEIDKNNDDSKIASTKIKIGAKISLSAMIKASIDFIYQKTNSKKELGEKFSVASNSGYSSVASNSGYSSVASNSGYSSVASNSGDSSVASNSGDRSVASNSGDRSVASNSGYRSVAVSWGIEGKVSGSIGTTLVCAEWKFQNDNYEKVGAKLIEVDGKKIKADTFYTLKNGKFVEVI